MSLLVKALLLMWPFLRGAIFGKKSIRSVLLENVHLVVMYLCVLALFFTMSSLHWRYETVKSENFNLHIELTHSCTVPPTLLDRQRALGDLLK